jgi:mannose-6-phosphate isomerase-like protein (cupin superfamily)
MKRSFTLRRLLAFALLAAVLLPLAIGAATWFGVRQWQQDRRSAHVAAATKLIEDGVGRFDSPAWRRNARRRLDTLGIGAQIAVVREPGSGQEELYVVLDGNATFEVDGETVEAPTGTFVFVRPESRRKATGTEPSSPSVPHPASRTRRSTGVTRGRSTAIRATRGARTPSP